MKKKKFLLVIAMAISALTVSAQTERGFRMGVRITTGMSNVIADGNKFDIGYGFGWVAEFNVTPHLYLQSGLGAENIAHKAKDVDKLLNTCFLQIPLHVGARWDTGNKSSIFVQGGPTFGYGIFGSKIKFADGGEADYFDSAKRFDLGVGGRIGFEYSSFQLSAGANYGVLDALKHSGGHNFIANAGLSYMF